MKTPGKPQKKVGALTWYPIDVKRGKKLTSAVLAKVKKFLVMGGQSKKALQN